MPSPHHHSPQWKIIEINRIATGYLDCGDGETIVALHGIPTSSRLFCPLLPWLRGYRLIAPDLLGQGHTGLPSTGRLDYAAYAEHLRGWMDAVPPRRFHLLVHDFGGVLGLDWATENPERLKSLAILSTTITGSVQVGRLFYLANLVFGPRVIRWGIRRILRRPLRLDAQWMEEWVEPWSRRRILRGMDHFAGHHLRRIRAKLDRLLHVPVLVIWGDRDDVFPLINHALEIVNALPHAEFHVIPECGHWSPLEAPEALARLLVRLMQAVDEQSRA